MYQREDFLNLKRLSRAELKLEYARAEDNYMDILEYTDHLEKNPGRMFIKSTDSHNKPYSIMKTVYALTVSDITKQLGNVERYMTAIYTYLETSEEEEPDTSVITVLSKNKKRKGIKNVLF